MIIKGSVYNIIFEYDDGTDASFTVESDNANTAIKEAMSQFNFDLLNAEEEAKENRGLCLQVYIWKKS